MTTLITGGLGFIGAHTVRAFAEAGERVVATFYESHRVPTFLAPFVGDTVVLEQCDVGAPGAVEALAKKHGVDGIVQLAIHRRSSTDPGEDLRVNMEKLSYLLDGARAAGVKRVCWASNGAIFAELPQGPFHEETPVPLTGRVQPGAYKKAWEVLVYNYANNYAASADVEFVSMRISGVFGPTYRSMLNLPSRLCHAAARGEAPDFSEQRGGVPFAEDTYDLTYAPDVAEADTRAADGVVAGAQGLQHLTRGVVTTSELLAAVQAASPGFDAELQPGRSPRFRPNVYLDNERIVNATEWRPAFDIEAAAADYIAWLSSGEEY